MCIVQDSGFGNMPRFFVKTSDISDSGKLVSIFGDDAAHITRVLRMKPGENVTVCDEYGTEYLTEIVETGDMVICAVVSSKKSETEPPYRVTVYQALVKGDRFDTVLQKATELGATEFVPIITSRCVVTVEPKEYEKKLARWQRIVYEASKQCGRGMVPTVRAPIRLTDALKKASVDTYPLFCYEGDGTVPLNKLTDENKKPESISVIIGPEGGFSDDEVSLAKESGIMLAGLGKRILRTETAAPFVLACISFKYEL
mgnify:CR=1 FL=1